MDYLTKYYKNLSESLQERVNILQRLVEDKKDEISSLYTIPSPITTSDIGLEPEPKYFEQLDWPLPQTGKSWDPFSGVYHEGGKPFTVPGHEGEFIYYRPERGTRGKFPGYAVKAPSPDTLEYTLASSQPSPYHQGGKPFTVPGQEGEFIYYRPERGPIRGKFPGYKVLASETPSVTTPSNVVAGIVGGLLGDLVVKPAAEKAGVFDAVEKGTREGLSSLPQGMQDTASSAIDTAAELGQWIIDPQGSYNEFLGNQAKKSPKPTETSRAKAEERYSRKEY